MTSWSGKSEIRTVQLFKPRIIGSMSVEQALAKRRSRKAGYSGKPVSLSAISQLCWAAQGITEPRLGLKAAPSARRSYPIELYIVVFISDLEAGIYHYKPSDHTLEQVKKGDYSELKFIKDTALTIIITGVFNRTIDKCKEIGERAKERYVWLETGHVAENIYLQTEALNLGTVSIGTFRDEQVQEALSLSSEYTPIYVMPVGHYESSYDR